MAAVKVLAFALAAAAVIWAALLAAAPVLPAVIAAPLYAIGSLICHQIPERSFHLAGAQLPVCARCIGIYAGVAVSVAGWGAGTRLDSRALVVAGAMPVAVTVSLEWLGIWHPSNAVRAASGLLLGLAVGIAVASAVKRDRMRAAAARG